MRKINVGFPESIFKLIEREAHLDGTSINQYLRDCALMRTGFRLAERGEATTPAREVEKILREANRP